MSPQDTPAHVAVAAVPHTTQITGRDTRATMPIVILTTDNVSQEGRQTSGKSKWLESPQSGTPDFQK